MKLWPRKKKYVAPFSFSIPQNRQPLAHLEKRHMAGRRQRPDSHSIRPEHAVQQASIGRVGVRNIQAA